MSSNMENVGRIRIHQVLDEQSFVEIGGSNQSDGVVTGYGQIGGELVFIYAQDPECLGGSLGEMHCKKIVQLFGRAKKMKAPIIGILDSAGIRLEEAVCALEGMSAMLFAIAQAKQIVPVYTIIAGTCAGSLGIIPGMSDFVFREENHGECFVNSINTITFPKNRSAMTFGLDLNTTPNQFIDFTGSLQDIAQKITHLCKHLPQYLGQTVPVNDSNDDLNRNCMFAENNSTNLQELLEQVSDSGFVLSLKESYCENLFTGFILLGGNYVGVMATSNPKESFSCETRLDGSSLRKATQFLQLCDRFHIPFLSILNTDGIQTIPETEKEFLVDMSNYIEVYSKSNIPKICFIPDHSYGSCYSFMGSKEIGTDAVLGWKGAHIGPLNEIIASKIMKESSVPDYSIQQAANHGYVDCLFLPEQTRCYLISFFEMLATKTQK